MRQFEPWFTLVSIVVGLEIVLNPFIAIRTYHTSAPNLPTQQRLLLRRCLLWLSIGVESVGVAYFLGFWWPVVVNSMGFSVLLGGIGPLLAGVLGFICWGGDVYWIPDPRAI